MKILVVGASGYLGRHVARHAVACGDTVVGTYHRTPADIDGVVWQRLDVTEPERVGTLVGAERPDIVVSSAYAGVSLAIDGPVNWATNALGAVNVARAAVAAGCRLVHVSSDAVHGGGPEAIPDGAYPDPINPYGAAKAAAELAIASVAPAAAIARISLVNSSGTGELSKRERFMLDLAAGRTGGVLWTDGIRCPAAVTDLAAALRELAGTGYAGTINLAGPDAISFHDLGILVVRRYGGDPSRLPIGSVTGAGRPAIVVLDTSLAASLLRTRIRGIREVLA